jgi:uncharacterized membrane protein YkoI
MYVMKFLSLTALSFVLALSPLTAAPAFAKEATKITRNEAQHIALKSHRGARVTSATMETVDGKLVWAIEITGPKERVTHVNVDAMSGHIILQTREKR